jgi:hypothetical protein
MECRTCHAGLGEKHTEVCPQSHFAPNRVTVENCSPLAESDFKLTEPEPKEHIQTTMQITESEYRLLKCLLTNSTAGAEHPIYAPYQSEKESLLIKLEF